MRCVGARGLHGAARPSCRPGALTRRRVHDFRWSGRLIFAVLVLAFCLPAFGEEIFIRTSQVGYHMNEAKVAIAFSKSPLPSDFTLVAESNEGNVFFTGKVRPVTNTVWGQFEHHVELDFSSLHTPGRFILKIDNTESLPNQIASGHYG